MPFDGVTVVPILMGREGLWGIRNSAQIPLGAFRTLRNVTLEDSTVRKMGGAAALGSAIGAVTVHAAIDYWLDVSTQRTLAFTSDGVLQKDDGSGASWANLATGLSAAGVPAFTIGGAEELGKNRKAFFFDGVNSPRVLSGDAASAAAISRPADDWVGTTQPRAMTVHDDGRMWAAVGNNLYGSLPNDHEDFTSFRLVVPVASGNLGEYIAALRSYKGLLLAFKYPRGAYAVDPSEASPRVIKFAEAGVYGPQNVQQIEDDLLSVAPDGSWHLASATQATGSVRATDITAKRLGAFFREQINLAQLAAAQLVYYAHKGVAKLACHSVGQTTKNRVVNFDVLRATDVGERWSIEDRDRNEALFLRKKSGIEIPAFGDAAGQIWELDQTDRGKAGAAYTMEAELWDNDFARLVPKWEGRRKHGRFLQVEYDPRTASTLTVDVIADGLTSQSLTFALSSGPGALPQTLPFTLAGATTQLSQRKRMLGVFTRLALRCRNTGLNEDSGLIKLLVGMEYVG